MANFFSPGESVDIDENTGFIMFSVDVIENKPTYL